MVGVTCKQTLGTGEKPYLLTLILDREKFTFLWSEENCQFDPRVSPGKPKETLKEPSSHNFSSCTLGKKVGNEQKKLSIHERSADNQACIQHSQKVLKSANCS